MRLTSPLRSRACFRDWLLSSWWWFVPLVSFRASGDDRGEWAIEVQLGWRLGTAPDSSFGSDSLGSESEASRSEVTP